MRLRDFLAYDNIVIQCHDNPDADAIASGFGVCMYLKSKGKSVRFVYGGKYLIQKSNLVLMVSELKIPVEHVENLPVSSLLVMVDCQYGQGNVTRFDAETVAVIDHHQISGELPEWNIVRSNLGSCATLVYDLLRAEGIDVNADKRLATALYYGLMTDTNNFAEIFHPLDRDLRDDAVIDRSLITRFKNSNLSLEELEIAGLALIGYDYHETHHYAVAKAQPCDPNVLGIISDLMLEVDTVDVCIVYSVLPFGIKLSVRSCVKEIQASELAAYITEGIGSGGGHLGKAGGFIQKELLGETDIRGFFQNRLNHYFEESRIIYASEFQADLSEMQEYKKCRYHLGYVKATDIFEPGVTVRVRTLEGDLDVGIRDDIYIMIGIKGEIYPIKKEKFLSSYEVTEEPYHFEGEYEPTVKETLEEKNISLVPYAKSCISTGESRIYAKELTRRVKVFTEWDGDKYMLGKEGDYLAVRADDLHDVYVIEREIFGKTYYFFRS